MPSTLRIIEERRRRQQRPFKSHFNSINKVCVYHADRHKYLFIITTCFQSDLLFDSLSFWGLAQTWKAHAQVFARCWELFYILIITVNIERNLFSLHRSSERWKSVTVWSFIRALHFCSVCDFWLLLLLLLVTSKENLLRHSDLILKWSRFAYECKENYFLLH